jgi:hypothetical protein
LLQRERNDSEDETKSPEGGVMTVEDWF